MDRLTYRKIFKNIRTQGKDKTLIKVTHKMEVDKEMDFIHLLDEGCLVESGTHETLNALGKQYSKIFLEDEQNMKIGLKKYSIDKEGLPKSLIFAGLSTFAIYLLMAIGLLLYIPIQKKIVGKAYIYPSGLNMPIKAETTDKIHYQISSDVKLNTDQIIATIDWDFSEDVINQLVRLYTLKLDRYSSSVLDQIKE